MTSHESERRPIGSLLFLDIFPLTEGEGIAFGSVCLLGNYLLIFDKYVDRLLFVCLFARLQPKPLNRSF